MISLKRWMIKVTSAIHNLQHVSANGRISGMYPNGGYSSNLPEGWFSTGTILTLAPHTAYLVIGQSSDNNGGLITAYSQAVVTSGTEKYIWIGANQPYGNAGNKHLFFSYVETGNASIGVGVNAYIYSQSDRGYIWYMLAIPIGYC